MLHIKIRIFAFSHQSFNCCIVKICHSSAVLANDLHTYGIGRCQFVFSSRLTSLPAGSVQNVCQNEQVERIIHRTHRNSFLLAYFCQLLCRERLRQLADLLQDHITDHGRSHVMLMHVGAQSLECCLICFFSFHNDQISFMYARRRLCCTWSIRLKKSKILLFFSNIAVVSRPDR